MLLHFFLLATAAKMLERENFERAKVEVSLQQFVSISLA